MHGIVGQTYNEPNIVQYHIYIFMQYVDSYSWLAKLRAFSYIRDDYQAKQVSFLTSHVCHIYLIVWVAESQN